MRFGILLTIIFFCYGAFAQEYRIKTTNKPNKDYYPWITFLSEGETNWDSEDETGLAYRVVITTYEIYDEIMIEKTSCGSEGGNKTIQWSRTVDTDELIQALKLEGEFSGVSFEGWVSWDSFHLKLGDKKVLFEDIGLKEIRIKVVG